MEFLKAAILLKRASLSVPLNIAKGSGKSSPQETRRFFEIALSSALEYSAIVNCARTLSLTDHSLLDYNRALNLLNRANALKKLPQSIDDD